MQFDPRIVRADETIFDQGDLKLPADLELMGQQLGDDAARLASCYPAPAEVAAEVVAAAAAQERSGRRRAWSLAAGSLAGLIAASVLALVALRGGWLTNGADERGGMPAAVAESAASGPLQVLPEENLTAVRSTGALPRLTPAVLDGGITAPQMEAWIDLRDDVAMDVERIEF